MFRVDIRSLLVAVAALMAAAAVGVSPAMARDSEADRLGRELSTIVFTAIDLRAAMIASTEKELGSMTELKDGRPEWPALFKESIVEEFDHDMPAIEAMLGKGFARYFTLDELRAGTVILADPALQQVMRDAAAGKPAPTKDPKLARETERLVGTPAGKRFLEKFGKIEGMLDGMTQDLIVEVLPGMLRRFGEKAEALEAARAR